MEREKKFEEAEKILREAGYRISRGIGVSISLQDACGGECTGGCKNGCYTCSVGTSQAPHMALHPTFQFSSEGVLEELVTISEGPGK